MNIATVQKSSMALPLIAMLALAGCGGGGGSNAMNTGGPQPPGTGTGQLPPPASQPVPTLAELIPDPANTFAALSGSISQDFDSATAAVTDRFSIKSVASDGAGGYHVTYVLDGRDETVHFESRHLGAGGSDTAYTTEEGHWLWSYTGSFHGVHYAEAWESSYFRALGSSHPEGARIFSAYGTPTPSADMPATGTATYAGRMTADAYDNTLDSISTRAARSQFQGSVVLAADFADATVEGRIYRIRVRPPGETAYNNLASTNRVEITEGAIADGQFTAALTGVDDNANAPLAESVRGFRGDVSGQFYGPAAEEFGAVFTATRSAADDDDWTVLGNLRAARADLIGGQADSEPLSAGVNRLDYSSASPRIVAQGADNRVTAVASDGAEGYRISYLVEGTPQTVTLSADDIGNLRPEAYSRRDGTRGWFLRRPNSPGGRPLGRHYSVKDWAATTYPDGASPSIASGIWGTIVHGRRTVPASMPGTGSATYAGNAAAYVFDPAPGEGRAGSTWSGGYRGRLSLTADFAAGSISGRISEVEHSPRFFETASYRTVAGGAFTIANGSIQGNALSADLSGLGYSGTVAGAFYGPVADETAGVMQATGADGKILHGWFGGARQ